MDSRQQLKRKILASVVFTVAVVVMLTAFPLATAVAQEGAPQTVTPEQAEMSKWAFLAAAIAFGFGALGAGIGIANVGAAAMGAVSEKPEIAGQALIFIALAEGLVVFGFITALIILGRV